MSIRVRMSLIECKITTFPRIGKIYSKLFSLNIINLETFPIVIPCRTISASIIRKLKNEKGANHALVVSPLFQIICEMNYCAL